MKIPRSVIQQYNAQFKQMFSHRMQFAREYYEAEAYTQFNQRIYKHGVHCLKNDVKKKLYTEDTKQAKKIVYAWMLFAEALDRTNQLRGTVFCPRTQTVNIERAREIQARKAEQDEAEKYLRKKVYGEKWQQVKW
jgi:hypothetical protein